MGSRWIVQWRMRRAELSVFILAGLLMAGHVSAQDQDKKKDAELRTIHGMVVDKTENPVSTSIVYLKNLHTSAVKTYISDDAAKYRFSGLDPHVDYEIYAEHQGICSPPRTVSSFDTRTDVDITLKLSRAKCD
jgi:hypothetical protein